MLGLPRRCGDKGFRSFLSETPRSLWSEFKFISKASFYSYYVDVIADGEYLFTVHNLSKSQARRMKKSFLGGVESGYESIELEVKH